MRYLQSLALAAALQVPAVVSAQQIAVSGWVNRVDTANSTMTIRTLANPRTIQIAPNAVVRVNGAVSRLDQIPANSAVTLTTEKGPTGVLTATQINVTASGARPSAAAPAGSTVQGTLVGVNIPDNAVTVRTISGDHVVPLGTAPILVNGVRGSIRNFRLGQSIQIQRGLPTEASTDFVTQMVRVTYPATQVAGQPAAVRSRTRSYRTSYRSRRATTHRQSRRTRHKSSSRRQAAQDRIGARAAAALAGTAPASAVVTSGAGTVMTTPVAATTASATPRVVIGAPAAVTAAPSAVTTAPAAVAPGVVYVAPAGADIAVPPVTAVPTVPAGTAPTGIIGVGPATIAPDSRLQSGAAAPGTPDARNQAGASSGSAALGVGDPRLQSIAPGAAVAPGAVPVPGAIAAPGVLAPGALPAPGVPDPRFQSFGPNAVPGATVPTAPGAVLPPAVPSGFGRPGFVGPRVIPRPMITPRVVAPPAVRR